MARVEQYLVDGITQKPSYARLGSLWGLVITGLCCITAIIAWIFAAIEPNAWISVICATPGVIGCIPLCFQYVKRVIDSGKATELLKASREKV